MTLIWVSILAICSLVGGTLAADSNGAKTVGIDESMKTCLPKFPEVKKEEFMNYIDSGFKNVTNEQKYKCLIFCMGREMGDTDEKGVTIIDKAMQTLHIDMDKQQMRAIFDECAKVMGKDACDTAWLQTKCTNKKFLEHLDEIMVKQTGSV